MSDVTDKIHQHFSTYPTRIYPKGQIIIFADENPEHIYYIARGKVREYDVSYRGEEVIVNIFKPATFFPMSWAINRTPNTFFYKTEEETELRLIPPGDALAFLKDNPDVTLDLLSRVYRGLDGLLGRIVHLMSGSAKSRLAYELVTECQRFGSKQPDGSYRLSVNENDLASRSGLSRETVSREIRKMKDQDWVTVKDKSLTVNDLAALKKVIGIEV